MKGTSKPFQGKPASLLVTIASERKPLGPEASRDEDGSS